MSYEVKTQQFSGPLDKLLELIEQKQLDVTTLSLAEVTGDFIDYVKGMEGASDPKILADFVVVASRLVLIKSKVLLPNLSLTQEEESQIQDLEERLKLYREFKHAGVLIKNLFGKNGVSFGKDLLAHAPAVFYPSENLKVEALRAGIARVLQGIGEFLPKDERTVKKALVSMEEKMNELLTRLQSAAKESFKSMTGGKKRDEVVALFLAILHLLKNQKIAIEQEGIFGDIIIGRSQ